MSHPSSLVSVASSMIRPRLLYLSTSDVRDYSDASSVEIPLRDQAFAQEGFKLVYGVRSFGYNSSVMNISAKQKNNQLDFIVTYEQSKYFFNTSSELFQLKSPAPPNSSTSRYTVTLPDGNYNTVDELFDSLNLWIANLVPSGWFFDRTKSPDAPNNNKGLQMYFQSAGNFFTINYGSPAGLSVISGYTDNVNTLTAYDVNDIIVEIRIVPTESTPGLYDLLFTNVSSFDSNKPVCLPMNSPLSGVNPPDYISFVIDKTSYGTYLPAGYDETEVDVNRQINVLDNIDYGLTEEPNSNLLNTVNVSNMTYPIEGMLCTRGIPYIAYHTPSLNPIYVDVLSNLDNLNMTTSGFSKNLLFRQFVLGGEQGSNSFFNNWDTPIFNILDAPYISTVKLEFQSESDKWDFFNLEFSLELVIFEVEDEQTNKEFEEPQFYLPGADGFTTAIKQYHPSIQNPFPLLGSGQRVAVTEWNDITNRRVKKPRR